jgi:hypothetical protein
MGQNRMLCSLLFENHNDHLALNPALSKILSFAHGRLNSQMTVSSFKQQVARQLVFQGARWYTNPTPLAETT